MVNAEILAPDNAPEWMHNRSELWNAVEAVERRKDAQLAREIQISLPHELTPEQRLTLTREFVQEQFVLISRNNINGRELYLCVFQNSRNNGLEINGKPFDRGFFE